MIQPGVVSSAATRPASPFTGQCIFQTDTNQLLVWNGTAWVIPNQTTQNPGGLELITPSSVTNGSLSSATAIPSGSASSITINGVFSSTYNAYKVVCTNISFVSPGGGIYLALGTNLSDSGYYQGGFFVTPSTGAATFHNRNNASDFLIGTQTAGNNWSTSFDVINPFESQVTTFPRVSGYTEAGALGVASGYHNTKSSYSSFVIKGGGTMSGGTITVYGYRK